MGYCQVTLLILASPPSTPLANHNLWTCQRLAYSGLWGLVLDWISGLARQWPSQPSHPRARNCQILSPIPYSASQSLLRAPSAPPFLILAHSASPSVFSLSSPRLSTNPQGLIPPAFSSLPFRRGLSVSLSAPVTSSFPWPHGLPVFSSPNHVSRSRCLQNSTLPWSCPLPPFLFLRPHWRKSSHLWPSEGLPQPVAVVFLVSPAPSSCHRVPLLATSPCLCASAFHLGLYRPDD